jgi:hypothetical protein
VARIILVGCGQSKAEVAREARFEIPLQLEPGVDDEEEEVRGSRTAPPWWGEGEGSTPGGRRLARVMEQLALFA